MLVPRRSAQSARRRARFQIIGLTYRYHTDALCYEALAKWQRRTPVPQKMGLFLGCFLGDGILRNLAEFVGFWYKKVLKKNQGFWSTLFFKNPKFLFLVKSMTYDFSNFGRTRCQKTLVFVTLLSANLYAENQRKKESKSCESEIYCCAELL